MLENKLYLEKELLAERRKFKSEEDILEEVKAIFTQNEKARTAITKNLKKKEMLNPFKAIKNIFMKIGLQQHREYLKEWLYAALYIKGGDDDLQYKEIKK